METQNSYNLSPFPCSSTIFFAFSSNFILYQQKIDIPDNIWAKKEDRRFKLNSTSSNQFFISNSQSGIVTGYTRSKGYVQIGFIKV